MSTRVFEMETAAEQDVPISAGSHPRLSQHKAFSSSATRALDAIERALTGPGALSCAQRACSSTKLHSPIIAGIAGSVDSGKVVSASRFAAGVQRGGFSSGDKGLHSSRGRGLFSGQEVTDTVAKYCSVFDSQLGQLERAAAAAADEREDIEVQQQLAEMDFDVARRRWMGQIQRAEARAQASVTTFVYHILSACTCAPS